MKMVSTAGRRWRFIDRHLELVLEVGDGAQAAHDDARALLRRVVDQQAGERVRDRRASPSSAKVSRIIATRSSGVNHAESLCGLNATATITLIEDLQRCDG